MKRKLQLFVLTLSTALIVAFMPVMAFADDGSGVKISEEFPDPAFAELAAEWDYDDDGYLNDEELADIATETEINLEDYPKIKDLTGIKYFKNLQDFWAYNGCALEKADLSQNSKLNYIDIHNAPLAELILGNHSKLDAVIIEGTKLTTLDLTGSPNITYIYMHNNQLTSLDVSAQTKLEYLMLYKNKLTSLDVTNNTRLVGLDVANNKLTSLNVTNNTKLINLRIQNNNIATAPNISKNTKLLYYACWGNGFKALKSAKLKKTKIPFTGKAIKPAISYVKNGSGSNLSAKYYSKKYVNNVYCKGSHYILLKGKNGYNGILSPYFNIVPKKVTGIKVKCSKKGKVTVKWSNKLGKKAKVTGYLVYYKVKGKSAKQKYVSGASTKSTTITFAKKLRGKKVTIKVRALTGVNAPCYGPYSKSKTKKIKK